MTNNKDDITKALLDGDELEDIELQKKTTPTNSPVVVVRGIPIPPPHQQRTGTKNKRQGCCSCGCFGKVLCIGFLVLLLSTMALLGFAYHKIYHLLDDLTETTPTKFPVVEMTDAELDAVLKREFDFFEAIQKGDTDDIPDLVITQDELNGFVGHSDYFRGNMLFTFHENRIVEDFSLPMADLGLGERWLVGSEYFARKGGASGMLEWRADTQAENDRFEGPLLFVRLRYLIQKARDRGSDAQTLLELFLERGSFFGWQVPEDFVDEKIDLLESLYSDPANAEALGDILKVVDGIERVSIEEGRVVVVAAKKPQPRGESSSSSSSSSSEEEDYSDSRPLVEATPQIDDEFSNSEEEDNYSD